MKTNKFLVAALLMVVTALLFLLGKGGEAGGAALAFLGVVSLTDEEKAGFSEQEQKVVLAVKKLAVQMKEDLSKGSISKEELTAAISGIQSELKTSEGKTLKEQFEELKSIAEKQGTTLTELGLKYNSIETGSKSIGQVLEEAKDELKEVYQRGSGSKTFMIQMNHKGELVAKPFDTTKAAGPHATTANVGGAGNTSSIAQTIDAASLLRLGGDAPVLSQYRNSAWLFPLCNIINAGYEMPLALWYDEQARQGGSATVAEGATKPLAQYAYTLRSATYKKEAVLVGFTDEFALDFARLQSDILGKARVDLVNRINSAVLANVIAAATAYNTATQYKGGAAMTNVNDWDVIAAMAAQVENATFGATPNAYLVSTFKKYRMGTMKDSDLNWLNAPGVLSQMAGVSNPDIATDDVLAGDFKQYNVLMRGGLIVRVGYNGTDFAENRFSTVLEQFYFDFISTLRTPAIVKGPNFATVKTALTT